MQETPDAESRSQARSRVGKASIGAISLAAANAGLLFLYFYYDLTLFQLILVYWWECLWIGLFCALKLIVASMIGDPYENRWIEVSGGAGVLLSIVAIGFVGGEFIALFGALGFAITFAFTELTGLEADELLFDQIGLILGSSLLFLAGHGLSFVVNFLVLGEFRTARAVTLLFLPFRRCLALLGTIAIAFGVAYYVPGLASGTAFAVILIVLKLLWDYRLHLKERTAFAAGPGAAREPIVLPTGINSRS